LGHFIHYEIMSRNLTY